MNRLIITVAVSLLLIALQSCKKNSNFAEDKTARIEIDGLIPEHIIEGTILGSRLSQPNGMVSDNFGNLYLLDGGNNRIVKFDDKYRPIREAGGFGSAEGLLNEPQALTTDNGLNIYITDTDNRRISIFDQNLNFAFTVDLVDDEDPLKFGYPTAAIMNDHGEIWVADPDNSRIAVFVNFIQFDRFIGDSEYYSGLLLKPGIMAANSRGQIFVADIEYGRILIFDHYGTYFNDLGEDVLVSPGGIAFDKYDNAWIIDSEIDAIFCFDRQGKQIFRQDSFNDNSDYGFKNPSGLTILGEDKLALSDTGQNRVIIYKILYP